MEAALEAGAEDVVTYDDGAMMSTLHGKKWAKYATLWKRQSESRQRGSFHDPVHQS